ncbi:MAG: EamA family transporter [Candidatus Hodarchaeota archaeon]
MQKYFELFIVVLILPIGQLLFKIGVMRMGGFYLGKELFQRITMLVKNPYIWVGAVAYIAATLVWFNVLSKIDLSVALPALSLTFIITLFTSAIFLHESITYLRVIGVFVICFGVFLLSRS